MKFHSASTYLTTSTSPFSNYSLPISQTHRHAFRRICTNPAKTVSAQTSCPTWPTTQHKPEHALTVPVRNRPLQSSGLSWLRGKRRILWSLQRTIDYSVYNITVVGLLRLCSWLRRGRWRRGQLLGMRLVGVWSLGGIRFVRQRVILIRRFAKEFGRRGSKITGKMDCNKDNRKGVGVIDICLRYHDQSCQFL